MPPGPDSSQSRSLFHAHSHCICFQYLFLSRFIVYKRTFMHTLAFIASSQFAFTVPENPPPTPVRSLFILGKIPEPSHTAPRHVPAGGGISFAYTVPFFVVVVVGPGTPSVTSSMHCSNPHVVDVNAPSPKQGGSGGNRCTRLSHRWSPAIINHILQTPRRQVHCAGCCLCSAPSYLDSAESTAGILFST